MVLPLLAALLTGASPAAAATLFITNTKSDSVSVIDTDTLEVVNSTGTPTFTDDRDGAGNRIGVLMQLNFPSSTQPINGVTVFSETLTVRSYDGSVLTLSDGTRVIFANGTVSVQTGGAERRRAVRR